MKWIEFLHNLCCNTIALSLLLFLDQLHLAEIFYSSLIGCNMIFNSIINLSTQYHIMNKSNNNINMGSSLSLILFYCIVFVGIVGQLINLFPGGKKIRYVLFIPTLIEDSLLYLGRSIKG